MNQYVVIARDGSDSIAPDRRMEARPAHLAGARELKENNHFILGGAMLDKNGNMAGSVMIVQFENEEKLKEWYDNEPYITQNVWQSVEIRPFRVADV